MRLVIELDGKYKNLFYEAARATQSVIISEEPDFQDELPGYVKGGFQKGFEEVINDQTRSYDEVKKMLAYL